MVTNLGLPCRHFYAVLRMPNSPTHFHLGLLNRRYVQFCFYCLELIAEPPRWLANPELDISQMATVKIGHNVNKDNDNSVIPLVPNHLPPLLRQASPPPVTRTLPAKVIHHQAMTKFHDVLRHVHTEADLQDLNADLQDLM